MRSLFTGVVVFLTQVVAGLAGHWIAQGTIPLAGGILVTVSSGLVATAGLIAILSKTAATPEKIRERWKFVLVGLGIVQLTLLLVVLTKVFAVVFSPTATTLGDLQLIILLGAGLVLAAVADLMLLRRVEPAA